MAEDKDLSVRQAFHKEGNLHQLVIIALVTIKDYCQDILKQEDISDETKKAIEASLSKISRAEKVTLQADNLRAKIKEKVYEKIDPDEITIDV